MSNSAGGLVETVQSFARGLRVIASFDADARVQTLADVARRTELSRATVRRLLHTLEACGYARRVEEHGYALTPAVLGLGYAYLASTGLAETATPLLQQLSACVRESCSLAVLDGPDVVYVARVPGERLMTVAIGVGTRFPAYRTSLGRALLAWADDETVAAAWHGADRSAPTATTVASLPALREALAEVRARGWALVDQELEDGVRSVAAPVRAADGDGDAAVVAAVNVSTHTSRTDRPTLEATVVPAVLETAAAISTAHTANRVG